jgi:3(or 17)beta-hydroxysteroid dehydrogenase
MTTTGRLEGKVALITGAAVGLGRATAERMLEQGARVVLTDVLEEIGRAAAQELGKTACFETLDVTQPADWSRVMQKTLKELGRLDILVNNAGVVLLGDIESLSLEEWQQVHAVNLDGVFLGCQNGVEIMKQTGGGSIINLSSVSGLVGGHNLAAYNSSKGAVRLLTKSVALYCARAGYGIRCNSVHPTFIETAMVQSMIDTSDNPERTRDKLERQIPLGVIGEPDDVAHMIVYLASEESKFVTGAEFVVDGGVTAQ